MKKTIIAIILALLTMTVYADYIHHGFSVVCAKCTEWHNKDSSISKHIAYRTCEYKIEDGKVYALYKCDGGHQYWAEIK